MIVCQCDPTVRTPFCGRPGCEWPAQKPEEPTMSRQAWGDEDPFDMPEGCVAEDVFDELKAERDAFLAILVRLRDHLTPAEQRTVAEHTTHKEVDAISPSMNVLLQPIRRQLLDEHIQGKMAEAQG